VSVIATALKHMLAAGMAPEAIVAAVAEMEASIGRDPQAERRRAADRERKRLRNSAESAEPAEIADQEAKERSPKPPKENTTPLTPKGVFPPSVSEPSPKPSRGIRLPRGWRPEPMPDEFRAKLGLSVAAVESEFEKFVDYWQARAGPNGVKRDWDATWRNWLRNAAERKGKGQKDAATRNGRETIHDVARHEFERLGGELPEFLR